MGVLPYARASYVTVEENKKSIPYFGFGSNVATDAGTTSTA